MKVEAALAAALKDAVGVSNVSDGIVFDNYLKHVFKLVMERKNVFVNGMAGKIEI